MEVEDLGARRLLAQHLIVGTHSNDFSLLDGHRGGPGRGGIHRIDSAVSQDEFGARVVRGAAGTVCGGRCMQAGGAERERGDAG